MNELAGNTGGTIQKNDGQRGADGGFHVEPGAQNQRRQDQHPATNPEESRKDADCEACNDGTQRMK